MIETLKLIQKIAEPWKARVGDNHTGFGITEDEIEILKESSSEGLPEKVLTYLENCIPPASLGGIVSFCGGDRFVRENSANSILSRGFLTIGFSDEELNPDGPNSIFAWNLSTLQIVEFPIEISLPS